LLKSYYNFLEIKENFKKFIKLLRIKNVNIIFSKEKVQRKLFIFYNNNNKIHINKCCLKKTLIIFFINFEKFTNFSTENIDFFINSNSL
jgi:hypothetical protein